jgi:Na+-transporting NADH:ubiquinone oxidoreductase subunit NqrB
MPIFRPNEYFWEHHWDGKEEKWMAFARAVQNIIARELDVPTSESSLREKFEFKAIMKQKKKGIK